MGSWQGKLYVLMKAGAEIKGFALPGQTLISDDGGGLKMY